MSLQGLRSESLFNKTLNGLIIILYHGVNSPLHPELIKCLPAP